MSRRVLIVDDDPATTDHYARLLRLEHFDVVAAYSGEEGLASALARPPDAIVLDLRMNGMDGASLLECLRSHRQLSAIPVVMVTGDYFIDEPTLGRLARLKAEVHYKPLWADDLVAIILRLLQPAPA